MPLAVALHPFFIAAFVVVFVALPLLLWAYRSPRPSYRDFQREAPVAALAVVAAAWPPFLGDVTHETALAVYEALIVCLGLGAVLVGAKGRAADRQETQGQIVRLNARLESEAEANQRLHEETTKRVILKSQHDLIGDLRDAITYLDDIVRPYGIAVSEGRPQSEQTQAWSDALESYTLRGRHDIRHLMTQYSEYAPVPSALFTLMAYDGVWTVDQIVAIRGHLGLIMIDMERTLLTTGKPFGYGYQ